MRTLSATSVTDQRGFGEIVIPNKIPTTVHTKDRNSVFVLPGGSCPNEKSDPPSFSRNENIKLQPEIEKGKKYPDSPEIRKTVDILNSNKYN